MGKALNAQPEFIKDDQPLSPDLEAEIDRALNEATDPEVRPAVTQVEYLPQVHVVSLRINNGQRLLIPAEDLQFVSSAAPEQLQSVQIIGAGEGIEFPPLDVQFSTAGLLAGRYGNTRWMDQLEQRRAAALKSAA